MNKAQPIDRYSQVYQRYLACLTPVARLAWDVAIETGLRISDIITLKISDLAPIMHVRERKTGKIRKIYMSTQLRTRLTANAAKYHSPYCFPGHSNGHIHRDTIGRAIRHARADAQIDGIISMHSARKMYAIDLYAQYGDPDAVQSELGHEHLATTLLYIFGAHTIR